VEPNLNTAYNVRHEHGHPRLWVVTAAISDKAGFANFFTYNAHGASSSLTAMSDAAKARADIGHFFSDALREKGYPPVAFVPVLTLTQLLEAVPKRIQIIGLKTDMQGFDFLAVSAADRAALRRVDQIISEVNCNGEAFNPDAPANDFDKQWAPFMPTVGFKHDARVGCPPHPAEGNALWVRDDYSGPLDEWWHDQKFA